jgi:pantoate--beta-alanine ligase
MGALHEGHLSLIKAAAGKHSCVVVSIFVNPTQFGQAADYERYPRDVEADARAAVAAGADLVFAPTSEEMYPFAAPTVSIDPGAIARRWEGEQRPGHFGGVALIVTKLLALVQPDTAYFGEKDWQQYRVVSDLVAALDIPTDIVVCPTVRAADGLALSSRNRFLTAQERATAAAALSQLRSEAAAVARQATARAGGMGVRLDLDDDDNDDDSLRPRRVEARLTTYLRDAGLQPDYVAIVNPTTLEPAVDFKGDTRLLLAARMGNSSVRLLDTLALTAGNDEAAADPRVPTALADDNGASR